MTDIVRKNSFVGEMKESKTFCNKNHQWGRVGGEKMCGANVFSALWCTSAVHPLFKGWNLGNNCVVTEVYLSAIWEEIFVSIVLTVN